jgi:hypothetical protein
MLQLIEQGCLARNMKSRMFLGQTKDRQKIVSAFQNSRGRERFPFKPARRRHGLESHNCQPGGALRSVMEFRRGSAGH